MHYNSLFQFIAHSTPVTSSGDLRLVTCVSGLFILDCPLDLL